MGAYPLAHTAATAIRFTIHYLLFLFLRLWISTPFAFQRTAFKKNNGADAWSIMYRKTLYVEYRTIYAHFVYSCSLNRKAAALRLPPSKFC